MPRDSKSAAAAIKQVIHPLQYHSFYQGDKRFLQKVLLSRRPVCLDQLATCVASFLPLLIPSLSPYPSTNHSHGEMEDVAIFKIVSIVTVWLIALLGGLLPSFIASYQHHTQSTRVECIQTSLTAFSGGVFLAGGFLHLLHDAIENPALRALSTMDGGIYAFPYAELFCSLGFIGLLVVEGAAHAHVTKRSSSNGGTSYAYRSMPLGEPAKQGRKYGSGGTLEMPHASAHAKFAEGGSLAVSMVLFIALSFHSVMEGLGIGAQNRSAWGVMFAILVHKGLAAFALATSLIQSQQLRPRTIFLYMSLFSVMSIFGICIGWIFAADTSGESAAAGICVALASGTFIYVAVMEVLPQVLNHSPPISSDVIEEVEAGGLTQNQNQWRNIGAVCLGYSIFGLLAKWA
uniref:Zinc (Zn2)Iron (Fe2) Permease (ZIP) family putative n=1 Tax=Albugo laibachii Nc14 TaxID=890382 RepID=F0WQN0_9STRA|nr:zinc (Zn2)Iron (Fe2) Permease (ZIP) family putative [Albugo laibachii Nc14]|eukprot:CCA23639.1 zinc (Zn2)Iron (Fe2) Permease (ZIP) family putative [Albugo laibachii Nc14]